MSTFFFYQVWYLSTYVTDFQKCLLTSHIFKEFSFIFLHVSCYVLADNEPCMHGTWSRHDGLAGKTDTAAGGVSQLFRWPGGWRDPGTVGGSADYWW